MALDNQISQLDDLEVLSSLEALSDQAALSTDLVEAAGLQNISVDVDAAATISSTSTAKSTADSSNVSNDSASAASVEFNSGLREENSIISASNAGLSGTAGTTVKASAATSNGNALSYAQIKDSAGIQGVTDLTVGGELNAIGKAVNTITSSSETVVGSAEAGSNLSGAQLGLQANQVGVNSDATIQGLAQLTNSASATATSGGNSLAEAFANNITGANLDSLEVGGVAKVTGQAIFGNTANSSNVAGSSTATADLERASGFMQANDAGLLHVDSDAQINGITSIVNNASAASTSGDLATATASAGTLEGAHIGSDNVVIGGVGSIAGQATLTSKANAANVVGDSSATAQLEDMAQGLKTYNMTFDDNAAIDISSDGSLKGIAQLNMEAAASTTAGEAVSRATANIIDGAQIGDITIGGIGSLEGQVAFSAKASAANVTGVEGSLEANATAFLENATGLNTNVPDDDRWGPDVDLDPDDGVPDYDNAFDVAISSDASIKGLTSVGLSAMAESTGGDLATDAISTAEAGTIKGASLGQETTIGGIGNVLGQVGFTGTATANNVSGSAQAFGTLETAMGLQDLEAMNISSDGTLKGIASVTAGATAETTAGDANAAARADAINGADFNDLVDIGGIGSIQGAASFNLSAKSTNVTGDPADSSSAAAGEGNLLAVGLKSFDTAAFDNYEPTADKIFDIKVASDATLSGTAIGSLKAEAFSTATNARADLGGSSELKGAELTELHVGGIANVTGAAQLTGNATASSVDGLAQATSGFNSSVTGLTADLIEVASNATITAQAFGTHNATATSTGGGAFADAANTQLTGISEFDQRDYVTGDAETVGLTLEIGGVGTVSALAQGSQNATATSVDGRAGVQTGMGLLGAEGLNFQSSSDGSLTAMAKLVANGDASNIGGSAKNDAIAVGYFSATGFEGLEIGDVTGGIVGIGGISTLKGQAQITGTLNAESVSGNAAAGTNAPDPDGNDFRTPSYITGMTGVELNGASDGTILGTASGLFNTTASSTLGDAYGFSGQNLRGISTLDLNLGGNGGINAIVQDTNFVTAHSVSGNATAEASVDAIGLEGGHTVHISGNATIMGNVGVDSKAEAHTTGG